MAHLVITMYVVSATGHHWWLDGIVALGLLWIALRLDTLGRQVVTSLRTASVPTAVPLGRRCVVRAHRAIGAVESERNPVSAHPDVIADLDRLGLDYVEMDCDPALADTAQFCEAYGIALEESANAILVASKKPEGHHAVCVALAHTRLDVNGTVRRKLGVRKLSFAPADLTRELTGQEIGGVTIFGLPEGLPVWLDARILGCARIIVGAGSRSAKISLDPSQLVGLEGYEFVDDLAVDIAGDLPPISPAIFPAKRPDPVVPDPTPKDRLRSLAASQGLFRGDLVEAGPDQLAHEGLRSVAGRRGTAGCPATPRCTSRGCRSPARRCCRCAGSTSSGV